MEIHRPLCLWRLYRAAAETLRLAVGVALGFVEWYDVPRDILNRFRDTPRKRSKQSAQILGKGLCYALDST
jgi:hypothetical protein